MGGSSGAAGVGGTLGPLEHPLAVPGASDFLRLGADWLREGDMGSGGREGGRCSRPGFTSDSVSKSRESLSKLFRQLSCNISLSLESYACLQNINKDRR